MSTPELRTRELMEELRGRIDVAPAPTAELMRGGRRRRQTRHLALAVAATVVAASLAGGALVLRDRGPDVVSPVKVGLDAPWWADGFLQAGDRVVPLEGVDQVVDTPAGVVVAQATGDVVLVDGDGQTTVIGHRAWVPGGVNQAGFGYRVLADDGTGQVCWIDKGIGGQQLVVVYDPVAGREVARHRIDTDWPDPAQLLAFEDGIVYYDQRDGGNRAWTVSSGKVEKLGTGASYVMDVENDVWITLNAHGDGMRIRKDRKAVAPLPASYFSWQLSPDARWVVARRAAPGENAYAGWFAVTVWEVATGAELPTGLPDDAIVEGVSWDEDGRIVYAVGATPAGPVDLVSCDPATATCTTVVDHAADAPQVVLADDLAPLEESR